MGVNASLCLVSELKPFTQYNINMTVLGLDEIGDEITSLSLQFTFYTKATGENPRFMKITNTHMYTFKIHALSLLNLGPWYTP